MNKDIEIMIKLQNHWDLILKKRKESDKSNIHISELNKDKSNKIIEIDRLKSEIKKLKAVIKENELSLSEIESKLEKSNERVSLLKTEREITALNHEIDKLKEDKDGLENELIILMDDLDQKENNLNELEDDLKSCSEKYEVKINDLNSAISENDKSISSNQDEFDKLAENLTAALKSKFTKLINTSSGKGIGEVTGEICSCCNFKIPSYVAVESSKEDKVVTCTNCGRFIYKN